MHTTKTQLVNLIKYLAVETGRAYALESGSACTQWKLCDEKCSQVILRANTKTDLYTQIQAYRDIARYIESTK